VLQNGCQQHDVVLLISIKALSFLDRSDLHRKLGVGRSKHGGHLDAGDGPPFLSCPKEKFASAAAQLEQTSFASQQGRCFSCKRTAGLNFFV
jgi:hypothetical protein